MDMVHREYNLTGYVRGPGGTSDAKCSRVGWDGVLRAATDAGDVEPDGCYGMIYWRIRYVFIRDRDEDVAGYVAFVHQFGE